MKKLTAILISFFFFLNFTKYSFATDWIKYQNNPVLSPSSNDWDSSNLSSASVIKDQGNYKMWYQANGTHWQIGLATSNDGINWTKYENNPVIVPANESGFQEAEVLEPAVLKTDIYRMWFKSNNQGDTQSRLRLATSTDGLNWQKNPQPILIGEKSWENKGVANPTVIYKDGKYLMWYMAWGYSLPWKIGYAESTDGINWIKYANNPLSLPNLGHVGAPHVIYENNKFYMVYHTGGSIPNVIYLVESDDGINWHCQENCLIIKSDGNGFDSWMMGAPNLMKIGGKLYLWYGGLRYGSSWKVGLAIKQVEEEKPITILIPGFFASWNKEAIIYNQPVALDQWKLNPFVKEYEGIINTFKNLGLVENIDFYVFSYDWRKNLDSITSDLNTFIQEKIISSYPNQTINILGHSLGGLVARIWQQKYSPSFIKKIITVGSPHQGVTQTYKVVEAGEIEKQDNYLWLAQKIILQLHKDSIKTDKQVISEKFPALKDLLPIYSFLKNENGEEIQINNMKIINSYLLSYLPIPSSTIDILFTIIGKSENTLYGYKIKERTIIDQLLDLYPDGRPTKNSYQIGDGLILSTSAKIGNSYKEFNLNHGEIIYKKEPISSILDVLSLSYQTDQIIEGQGTQISPSIIFLVMSPVFITVQNNLQSYSEKDGLLIIDNAPSGKYTITAVGKDYGKYSIIIGKLGTKNDSWTRIDGEITQDPPSSQSDIYEIDFDQENVEPTPSSILINTPTPTITITPTSTPNPTNTSYTSSNSQTLSSSNISSYPLTNFFTEATNDFVPNVLGESTTDKENTSPFPTKIPKKLIFNPTFPIFWPIILVIVVLISFYFLIKNYDKIFL